jgi:DNA-binding MltR family transcriptional regulator
MGENRDQERLSQSSTDDSNLGPPTKESLEIATMLLHQQESDRGCVIFSAAMLEEDLESLLRACCLSDQTVVKKIVDPLFRGYAPLSTLPLKFK